MCKSVINTMGSNKEITVYWYEFDIPVIWWSELNFEPYAKEVDING